jgi:hypothetical protein
MATNNDNTAAKLVVLAVGTQTAAARTILGAILWCDGTS